MTFRILSVLMLGAVAATLRVEAAEKTVRRSFPAGPGCGLKVGLDRGEIEVVEGDGPEVVVTVRMSVISEDKGKVDRAFAGVRLEIGQEGRKVSILGRDSRADDIQFDWQNDVRVDLSVKVTVPRACDVDLTAEGAGDITVGNLKGAMTARARSGSIYFKEIDGSVRAELDEGGILLSHCTGSADLRTKSGSIQVGTAVGAARLWTGNGDIEIQHAAGGVVASAEAGGITAGFPATMSGDSRLVTDGGGIFVKIDPAAACTVHATSSVFGDVRVSGPFVASPGGNGRSRYDGTLNGGGRRISIDASGGHVKIETYQ